MAAAVSTPKDGVWSYEKTKNFIIAKHDASDMSEHQYHFLLQQFQTEDTVRSKLFVAEKRTDSSQKTTFSLLPSVFERTALTMTVTLIASSYATY